jgi:mono/diheme cytochrome c family protein
MRCIVAMLTITGLAFAQDAQQRGRAEEQRACVPCHSLRLVESQRLSAVAWGKELDKMERWGAAIKDRQVLLDYLSTEYPDTKPIPPPDRSSGASKDSPHAH